MGLKLSKIEITSSAEWKNGDKFKKVSEVKGLLKHDSLLLALFQMELIHTYDKKTVSKIERADKELHANVEHLSHENWTVIAVPEILPTPLYDVVLNLAAYKQHITLGNRKFMGMAQLKLNLSPKGIMELV